MPRQFKGEDKLFGGNAYKRTANVIREERDGGVGKLYDFQDGRDIYMRWANWRGPFEDDMVFLLEIGGRKKDKAGEKITVALSKEDLMRFLRYV